MAEKKRIVLTGATGLIGSAVANNYATSLSDSRSRASRYCLVGMVRGIDVHARTAVAKELLKKGHDLVIFSRDPEAAARKIPGALEYVSWQPQESGSWSAAIDGTHAVIHCAAPSIFARRYSKSYAQETLTNRIVSTRGLVNALKQAKTKPGVFISSASQGITASMLSATFSSMKAHQLGQTIGPKTANPGRMKR